MKWTVRAVATGWGEMAPEYALELQRGDSDEFAYAVIEVNTSTECGWNLTCDDTEARDWLRSDNGWDAVLDAVRGR